MASQRNGTLYIGVTNDLERRVAQHKEGTFEGFTKHYKVKRLVYFELFSDVNQALTREKQLKKWNRQWKIDLIEKRKPEWIDLSTVSYQTPFVEPPTNGFPHSRE